MKQFNYTITDPLGIHARPAGLFVKEAARQSSKITLEKDGKLADTKSIFGVMGLAVKQGQTITVSCEGGDEEASAEAMESFLKNNM